MSLRVLSEIIKSYKYNSVTVEQIESLSIMLQHKAFEPIYPLIAAKILEFEEEEKEIQKKISVTSKMKETQNMEMKNKCDNTQLSFTLTGFDVQESTDVPPEPYDLYDPYEDTWISEQELNDVPSTE